MASSRRMQMNRSAMRGLSTVVLALAAAWLSAAPSAATAQTLPGGADQFPGVGIDALPYTSLANTEGATVEEGEPLGPNSGATLWFHFTAVTAGAVGIELEQHSSGGGHVSVFTGDAVNDLTPVEDGGTGSVGPWATVFRVEAGVTYRVQVASSDFPPPYESKLALTIRAGLPPANDVFPGHAITSLPFSDVVDTTFATMDDGEPSVWGGTVWYSFVGPPGGVVMQADTLGTAYEAPFSIKDAGSLEIPGGTRGEGVVCRDARVSVFSVAEGEQVWFQVGSQGFPGPRGLLHFSLHEVAAGTVPSCPAGPEPSATPAAPATGMAAGGAGSKSSARPTFMGIGAALLIASAFLGVASRRHR